MIYFYAQGPDLVIHQTKECLEKMGEWCQDHHAASGKYLLAHSQLSKMKDIIHCKRRDYPSHPYHLT